MTPSPRRLVTLVAILSSLMGAASGAAATLLLARASIGGASEGGTPLSREIVVSRLSLVAPDGTPCGSLEGSAEGGRLTLFGRNHGECRLLVEDKGTALLLEMGEPAAGQRPASVQLVAMQASGSALRLSAVEGGRVAQVDLGAQLASWDRAVPLADLSVLVNRADVPVKLYGSRIEVSGERGTTIRVDDRGSRERLSLKVTESGAPTLLMQDAEGRSRISIGRTPLTTALGRIDAPEDTIATFGEDGVVRWRTPDR